MKQISFLKNNQRIHKIKTQNNQRMGKKMRKGEQVTKKFAEKTRKPKKLLKEFFLKNAQKCKIICRTSPLHNGGK